jgi:hypothetical protein
MNIAPKIITTYYMITSTIGFEKTKETFNIVFVISPNTSYHIPVKSFTFEKADFWDCKEITRNTTDMLNDVLVLFSQKELVSLFNSLTSILSNVYEKYPTPNTISSELEDFKSLLKDKINFDNIVLSFTN